MNTLDMMLERDTANDESAVVTMVFVESGTSVVKDEPLFEIENSKATEEHVSPGDGIVVHELAAGQTVFFGVTIARIVSPEEFAVRGQRVDVPAPVAGPATLADVPQQVAAAMVEPPSAPAPSPVQDNGPTSLATPSPRPVKPRQNEARFSIAALTLLTKHALSPAQFDADFVTSADVLAHVACQNQLAELSSPPAPTAPLAAPPAAKVPVGTLPGSPVGQRKRAEIETLSQGAGQTMLSVLGVDLGPLLVRRKPGDFLAGKITDFVLYESARLMHKYPRLNSFYADGQIFQHASIHAGLAIDDGGRLMVYGIEHADRAGLPELAQTIADAVGRYVNNELTAQELTRATFTVTDLSGGQLDFVLPLLPRGQSCIVGITSSSLAGYRLFAGFDHRVTEGREVMAFLNDLRDRLLSFATDEFAVVSATVCSFCGRSAKEAVKSSKDKGLLKVVGLNGEEVLCCGSCWSGW